MSRDDDVNQVCEFYRVFHPRARPDKKTRGKILERLRDGYTVQDLKDAIEGCHLSDFHAGKNDRNTKYQSLELIMRDSAHVQQFIELFDAEAQRKHEEYQEWKSRQEDSEARKLMRHVQSQKRKTAR